MGRKKKVVPPSPPNARPAKVKGMSEAASKFWDAIIDLLPAVTPTDQQAMLVACRQFELLEQARNAIKENGAFYEHGDLLKVNPAVAVAQTQLRDLLKSLEALGATPRARKRLGLKDGDGAGADPFEKFLGVVG